MAFRHKEKRKEKRQLEAQEKLKKEARKCLTRKEKSKKSVREVKKVVSEVVITTSDTGIVQTPSYASGILSKSRGTFTRFTDRIRTSPRLFAEDLYYTYVDADTDTDNATSRLSLIQIQQEFLSECVTSLKDDWNSLYQTVGACRELEDIKMMKAEVSLTLSYIDELEFFAALGYSELRRAYKAKELWLQT
ncbi:hypothetical protein E1B28_003363 [Marasmius oreades]|uniref:Uncharacterized protein n=1 Tax=Marasmius oreades TaxID=181124 RepID=A0A9P7RMF9_9AGAR|nr:uncharacterized protein E1B28_003363 [Marasmius oreades]KAG7085825.1 hypothetical protein E1B28_003363 [Marasmius oreades]